MSHFRNSLIWVLSLSLSMPIATNAEVPPKAAESPKLQAIDRYYRLLDHPEARTYGQMLQMVKPLVSQEVMDQLSTRVGDKKEDRFPKYELRDKGDHLDLVLGVGNKTETMTFYKKDPKNFAKIRGVYITHAEAVDGLKLLSKMDSAFGSKKVSVFSLLLGEPAFAEMDWGFIAGMAILATGIGAGLYFLSNMKVKGNVNVNVPTAYSLSTASTVAVTAPQVDPYLPKTNSKGQR